MSIISTTRTIHAKSFRLYTNKTLVERKSFLNGFPFEWSDGANRSKDWNLRLPFVRNHLRKVLPPKEIFCQSVAKELPRFPSCDRQLKRNLSRASSSEGSWSSVWHWTSSFPKRAAHLTNVWYSRHQFHFSVAKLNFHRAQCWSSKLKLIYSHLAS